MVFTNMAANNLTTPLDIPALKAKWEAATPGEWRIEMIDDFDEGGNVGQSEGPIVGPEYTQKYGNKSIPGVRDRICELGFGAHGRHSKNRQWIVDSHNAFPAILECIEALTAENERLKQEASLAWNTGHAKALELTEERDAALYFLELHDIRNSDELADRDARLKRLGAAEWLESFAKGSAIDMIRDEYPGTNLLREIVTAEAARLREGK